MVTKTKEQERDIQVCSFPEPLKNTFLCAASLGIATLDTLIQPQTPPRQPFL